MEQREDRKQLVGLGDKLGMESDEGDRVKDNCKLSAWIVLSSTEMRNPGIRRKENEHSLEYVEF